MRIVKSILLGLGILIISSSAQAQKKNQIGLQCGLFHYFLDGTPILNTNYVAPSGKGLYRGIFLNSWGIEYSRLITERSTISIEISNFRKSYRKYFEADADHPNIGIRRFWTFGIIYSRIIPLKNKFNFLYGAGINYRHGYENIIIDVIPIGPTSLGAYEVLFEDVQRRDLGLNVFVRFEYDFTKWLYAYSKIDFLGIVYMHDKEGKRRMEEAYNSPQFPSRYDLSLKFGIGIRF
ncbi:MAG: hypothetical protein QNK23_16055 [Crocinitomicaceae bacterium]|nr:hypothetical protein [Crocinitomicaceae bacterium]